MKNRLKESLLLIIHFGLLINLRNKQMATSHLQVPNTRIRNKFSRGSAKRFWIMLTRDIIAVFLPMDKQALASLTLWLGLAKIRYTFFNKGNRSNRLQRDILKNQEERSWPKFRSSCFYAWNLQWEHSRSYYRYWLATCWRIKDQVKQNFGHLCWWCQKTFCWELRANWESYGKGNKK